MSKSENEVFDLNIRAVEKSDLEELLELYTQLHDNNMPAMDQALENTWDKILSDENHHILIGKIGQQIVSSCVIVVVPNLTQNQRPYALIENVITHEDYRGKGYATELLRHAKDIAEDANCYKIMLLSGAKDDGTLAFYEKAGFNREDKTGFVWWL